MPATPDSTITFGISAKFIGAMTWAPDWTKEELERVGEQCLKFAAQRPLGWSYVPTGLRVAQAWVRHGIRLKDSVRMAEESLDQVAGVVCNGIFARRPADVLLLGTDSGVRTLLRP